MIQNALEPTGVCMLKLSRVVKCLLNDLGHEDQYQYFDDKNARIKRYYYKNKTPCSCSCWVGAHKIKHHTTPPRNSPPANFDIRCAFSVFPAFSLQLSSLFGGTLVVLIAPLRSCSCNRGTLVRENAQFN